jgi:hypothetical protein
VFLSGGCFEWGLDAQVKRYRRYSHFDVANHDAKRAALDLDLLLILGAPSNHAGRNPTGIWGVNRQGCRFSRPKSMADYGHTEPKRGAEWWGKSVLLTFALFKSEPP